MNQCLLHISVTCDLIIGYLVLRILYISKKKRHDFGYNNDYFKSHGTRSHVAHFGGSFRLCNFLINHK